MFLGFGKFKRETKVRDKVEENKKNGIVVDDRQYGVVEDGGDNKLIEQPEEIIMEPAREE